MKFFAIVFASMFAVSFVQAAVTSDKFYCVAANDDQDGFLTMDSKMALLDIDNKFYELKRNPYVLNVLEYRGFMGSSPDVLVMQTASSILKPKTGIKYRVEFSLIENSSRRLRGEKLLMDCKLP